MKTSPRLAVLIDADNFNAACVTQLMASIATYGNPVIKRAYGDWTTPHLAPWKKVLQQSAIRPCQQFGLAKGKNSSDCTLIMDAMEMLLSLSVDGFCIVSSDSDYTGLAGRIKEKGLAVYGFGTSDVAKVFRAACDVFVEIGPPETGG